MCVDLTISLLKLSQMNLLVFKGVTHWKVYELNFYIQAISRFSFELMFFSYRSLSAFSAYSSRPSSGPALPPLINSSLQKYRPTFSAFGHQSSARNMMFRSFNQVNRSGPSAWWIIGLTRACVWYSCELTNIFSNFITSKWGVLQGFPFLLSFSTRREISYLRAPVCYNINKLFNWMSYVIKFVTEW